MREINGRYITPIQCALVIHMTFTLIVNSGILFMRLIFRAFIQFTLFSLDFSFVLFFNFLFAFHVAFEIEFMIYHTYTHTHHSLFLYWSAISRSGQVFFIMCQNQYSFRILQHYKVQQTKMKANFQVKAFFDFTASTRLFGRLKFYLRFVLDNWCIFICFAYTQCTTDCLYSIGTFRYHLLFRLIGEIFGFTLSRLAFRIITNCSVSILFANTATVMWSENKKHARMFAWPK